MIRLAQPADAETIRALVEDAYAGYAKQIGRTPSPVKDDYDRRIAASEVWVLEVGDDLVGVVVLKEGPIGTDILLDNVAIRPSAQGKGFGRMLIAFAEQEACRRGFAEIRLYANVLMVKNIALYESLGFAETGRFPDRGSTRVSMSKRIDCAKEFQIA